MRGIWSGDVDLADGSLEKQYDRHQQRLEFLRRIGMNERLGNVVLPNDLLMAVDLIEKDIEHISTCEFQLNLSCNTFNH